ncbi:unnamed protein product, partial [marine sediment metagenome]
MIDKLEKVTSKIEDASVREISGIPLIITEEHQQVFPFWDYSDVRDATLIHVDSHPDLADEAPTSLNIFGSNLSLKYHKKLHVGNFICPAVHYGFIHDIFWISPFCKGSEHDDLYIQHIDKDSLKTKNGVHYIKWKDIEFSEKSRKSGASFDVEGYRKGASLSTNRLKKILTNNNSFILDIDLDAFAKEFYGPRAYIEIFKALNPGAGIDGWEKGLNKLLNFLREFQ